jgi:hypothetical protein
MARYWGYGAGQALPLCMTLALNWRFSVPAGCAGLGIFLQEQRGFSGQAGAEGECDAGELRPSLPQAIQNEENRR